MKERSLMIPNCAQEFLRYTAKPLAHQIVRQFHAWLEHRRISLANLTSSDVQEFLDKPANRRLSNTTRKLYSPLLHRYLAYLHLAGLSTYQSHPEIIQFVLSWMPPYAQSYLANFSHGASRCLKAFHLWLDTENLDIHRLIPQQVDEFLDVTFKHKNIHRTRRNQLRPYLNYLHENNLLSFNPDHTHLNPQFLPPSAREFLAEISITLKPGTINGYASTLRKFHAYLEKHIASIYDLQRSHVIDWLRELKDHELHPSTRLGLAQNLRVYLRWLYERNRLREHPDDLLRACDFPKLPDYLPRPLPPDIDRALQDFLLHKKQSSLFSKGLWLMRKAGLRIGELQSLELNCLRQDHHGNSFLKVPLGKLNNERLVPLAPETVQIVSELQQKEPKSRAFLISETLTRKARIELFYRQLRKASQKLGVPMQSHQLRHSCATELINSGMSLVSVMNFLGHKDFRMTLRYAKITQQTITHEFQQAMRHAEQKYHQAVEASSAEVNENGPILLANLIKWCHRQASQRQGELIIKRLHRLRPQIMRLQKRPGGCP